MSEVGTKELPENWEFTPLTGLLIEFETGTRPKGGVGKYTEGTPSVGAEHLDANGGFKFKKIKFVPEEYANSMLRGHLEEGDILVVKDGATTAKTSLIRKSFPHTNAVINEHVFRCKVAEGIEPKYVFYYLFSGKGQKEILSDFRGAAQGGITKGFAAKVNIPLAPPEQQKRIVAKIEELFSHIDAGIEALKKAKQLLKQYRQSVLKAAVTGELTKEWRGENKAKLEPAAQLIERILKERRQSWEEQQLEQFKAKGKISKDDKWTEKYKELSPLLEEELEGLPDLPEGWVYTRLGNVINEPKYGTSKKCTYDNNGIGVLRIPNVANGLIDSEDLKYASFEDNEIETYRLIVDDILIIRSNGSVNLVGKCALVGDRDTDYLYAGYLIRLRPNNVLANGSYLINCLNSIYLRNQIESKAKSTSGVNNINSGELQSLVISICSRDEQLVISRMVEDKWSASARLLKELDIQQIKAEKNKQSILASAFSGKLIESAPDDGDAKILLENIKKGDWREVTKKTVKETKRKSVPRIKSEKDKQVLMNAILKEFGEGEFSINDLLAVNIGEELGDLKFELMELIKDPTKGSYRLDMQFDEKSEKYVFRLIPRSSS